MPQVKQKSLKGDVTTPARTKKNCIAPVTKKEAKIDLRKSLVNGGRVGPLFKISLPENLITSINGILLDFDPGLHKEGILPAGSVEEPELFYEGFVRPMLDRHPVYKTAEIRMSGRGIHAIVNFAKPVELRNESDRTRWANTIRIVQRILPIDPDCPGITATTRALGSINSKNQAIVRQLEKGVPIDHEAVEGLVAEFRNGPFKLSSRLIFGKDKITPCPVSIASTTSGDVTTAAAK